MKHYKELKDKKENEQNNLHPLMDNKLAVLGISFKGHKKVDNLI